LLQNQPFFYNQQVTAVAPRPHLSARELATLRDRVARAKLRRDAEHAQDAKSSRQPLSARDDLLEAPEHRLFAAIEATRRGDG
jgi:hypothetical protein